MNTSTSRVQKHRDALRRSGLRPIQIWVPDTRQHQFLDECRRQSQLAAKYDVDDAELDHLLDESLADLNDWKP